MERGDKPLPRKMLITYKTIEGKPWYTALMNRWDTEPAFAEGFFTFKAPEDAERVEVREAQPEELAGPDPVAAEEKTQTTAATESPSAPSASRSTAS